MDTDLWTPAWSRPGHAHVGGGIFWSIAPFLVLSSLSCPPWVSSRPGPGPGWSWRQSHVCAWMCKDAQQDDVPEYGTR